MAPKTLSMTSISWPAAFLGTPQQLSSGAWTFPSPFHVAGVGQDIKYIFIPCPYTDARSLVDNLIEALNHPDMGAENPKSSSYQIIFKDPGVPTGYPTGSTRLTPFQVEDRCVLWLASAANWDTMVGYMFDGAETAADCQYPSRKDEIGHCAAYRCTAIGTAVERKCWLLNGSLLQDIELWVGA